MASLANGLLFLNHYKNKSKEEWELKIKTVNNYGYMKGKWIDKPFEFYEDKANEIENIDIFRFVKPLKKFMSEPLPKNPRKKHNFALSIKKNKETNTFLL